MIHKSFVIYDSCAMVYNQPFFANNLHVAIRNLETVLKDQQSKLVEHPEHFTLFETGSYDDETGRFEQYPELRVVISVLDLMAEVRKRQEDQMDFFKSHTSEVSKS